MTKVEKQHKQIFGATKQLMAIAVTLTNGETGIAVAALHMASLWLAAQTNNEQVLVDALPRSPEALRMLMSEMSQ